MYKIAKATPDSLGEVKRIMDTVYAENPSYWPYGLGVNGHDDVYLIRDKETNKAAGFVGWQGDREFDPKENRMLKVGYYTIGVLPEYRKKGYAKEAVQKIIEIKSASFDTVRAFIVPDNSPSIQLAKSLDIPVIHKVAASEYSKGCLMAYLPDADTRRVQQWLDKRIPQRFLSGKGYDRASHVTVLYGFNASVRPATISSAVRGLTDKVAFRLGKIARFPADENRMDSDVLYVKVISEDLRSLNRKLSSLFEIENSYDGYNPHMTLAYVKPGYLKMMDGLSVFENQTYVLDKLKYSTADDTIHTIHLGK